MKKFLLIIVGTLICTATCSAAETTYKWLTFTFVDNTEMSVASDNLNIAYDSNAKKLTLTSQSVNKTLSVEELASMRFADVPTAVTDILTDNQSSFEVYTLNGVRAGQFDDYNAMRQTLPSGIYLVKTTNKSFKIIF